jgi:hypothetical protein
MTALTIRSVFAEGKAVKKTEVIQLLEAGFSGEVIVPIDHGTWQSSESYFAGSTVAYGGSRWIALVDNTNVVPVDGAIWGLYIAGGSVADGSLGEIKLSSALTQRLGYRLDSVAAAEATQFPAAVHTVQAAGFSSIGIGGGLYARTTSPAILKFQDTNGDYWNLLDNEILPEQAGVVGNDNTKGALNALAFQKATNSGKRVKLAAAKTYFSDPFVLQGGLTGTKGSSVLSATDLANPLIRIDTNEAVLLENIRFNGYGAAGAAIYVAPSAGSNYRSTFRDLDFAGFGKQVWFRNAATWGVERCTFSVYGESGVWVQHDLLPDSGDSFIGNGCVFTGIVGGAGAGVVQKNGGGLKVIGNKFLLGQYGIIASYIGGPSATTQSTSVLVIEGNSIEHCTVAGIALSRDVAANAAISFFNANISGNHLNNTDTSGGSAAGAGITVADNLNIKGLGITNNVLEIGPHGGTGILVERCRGGIVTGNSIYGNGGLNSVGISLGAGFNGTVDPNNYGAGLTTPFFKAVGATGFKGSVAAL